MKLFPLFDRIVLKIATTDKDGSIILPETISEAPTLGEVVNVGMGGKLEGNEIEIQLSIGDKVLFHKYCASEFIRDSETLFIIKQADILCKVVE